MKRGRELKKRPAHAFRAVLFAALAVAARLPFLITGKIPFDSDEAVEGLMARHVLAGEFPAFFWGQAFKGVPEVYAAAGAFAVFGSGVAVLKSVTLMCFAAYVTLNFVLLSTISFTAARRRGLFDAGLLAAGARLLEPRRQRRIHRHHAARHNPASARLTPRRSCRNKERRARSQEEAALCGRCGHGPWFVGPSAFHRVSLSDCADLRVAKSSRGRTQTRRPQEQVGAGSSLRLQ